MYGACIGESFVGSATSVLLKPIQHEQFLKKYKNDSFYDSVRLVTRDMRSKRYDMI